ncbi:MAG: hypothetical protein U0Q21_03790 [Dermatophilaceae bacterium]
MSKTTPSGTGSASLFAGFVCGIEALALVVLALAYAVGIVRRTEDSLARTLASLVMFLVGAALLAAMARAWRAGAAWPRMATLVVNALLVPVSFSVIRGNGVLIGLPVCALALAGVAAAILAHPDEN